MAQRSPAYLSILSSPRAYDTLQRLLGADEGRRDWADHFIRARGRDYVLDVGCGTARILDYLPQNVSYWGYDVSERYIAAARERYDERAHFAARALSASELPALPSFDIVLAAGLLHHLNDVDASSLLRLAHAALRSGGRLVTIDPCYAPRQSFLARQLIRRDRGEHVRLAEEYLALARTTFSMATGTLRHRRWIPYTHWIMECEA
jgi:SAM-dependent methyltransferase